MLSSGVLLLTSVSHLTSPYPPFKGIFICHLHQKSKIEMFQLEWKFPPITFSIELLLGVIFG